MKDNGDAGFIRSFIVREAGIAIDAEDRLLRRADVARSKVHELMVEGGDQINGGRFDLLLIDMFVPLKPGSPVVTGKLAQKVEGSRRVTGEAHSFSHGFTRINSDFTHSLIGTEILFGKDACHSGKATFLFRRKGRGKA